MQGIGREGMRKVLSGVYADIKEVGGGVALDCEILLPVGLFSMQTQPRDHLLPPLLPIGLIETAL